MESNEENKQNKNEELKKTPTLKKDIKIDDPTPKPPTLPSSVNVQGQQMLTENNFKDYKDELVSNILEKEAKTPLKPTNIIETRSRERIEQQKKLLGETKISSWLLLNKKDKIEFGFEESSIEIIDQGISKLKEGIFHFSNLFRKYKEKIKR